MFFLKVNVARHMLGPSIEMFRLVYIAGVVCALLLMGGVAHADILRVKMRGPKGKVQSVAPSDGYSVIAIFRPMVPGLVAKLKATADPETVILATKVGRKDEEIRILFESPIKRQKVVRRGRKIEIEVEYKTRQQNLRDRVIKMLVVPVPSTFVGFRFDAAERLMRAGQFSDALAKYKELSEQYELRAWSQLRLSDIALLSGDVRGACRRYNAASEAFGVRISGMLSRLRRQVLGCGWNRGPQADWDILLERADRVPGRIGTFLREEAIWAMNQVSRPEEVTLAINLIKGLELQHKKLKRKLTRTKEVLLARAIRLPKNAVNRARMCYRHKPAIDAHSEAFSLRYLCAQAFQELSLVKEAVAELRFLKDASGKKMGGALWDARRGNSQAMYTLAEVYNDMGDADYVYATLVEYQRRFGYPPPSKIDAEPYDPKLNVRKLHIGKLVDSIDRRLYMIDRVVRLQAGNTRASQGGRK